MAKRKQKQTLKEFQAWLQGVEELQPEGWSPDADQWKLIRAKIDGIKEETKTVEAKSTHDNHVDYNNPIYNNPNMLTAPPTQGGVPPGPVDMTPASP